MMQSKEVEKLRQQYRPDELNILLVGESAPECGTFFYEGGNAMATYVRKCFEEVLGIKYEGDENFLKDFKKNKCYLDDLSIAPVNKMENRLRKETLEKCIPELASRIETYQPKVIVSLLKKIDKHVKSSIEKTSVSVAYYSLPFPGNGHQNKFSKELTELLRMHLK